MHSTIQFFLLPIEQPRRLRQISWKNFSYNLYVGQNSAKVCPHDNNGSPLFKKISGTARVTPFYEQHYIASSIISCQHNTGVYIRITDSRILPWIQVVKFNYFLFKFCAQYQLKMKQPWHFAPRTWIFDSERFFKPHSVFHGSKTVIFGVW